MLNRTKFNIELTEPNIEFGNYTTELSWFNTGFAKFNIEVDDSLLVCSRSNIEMRLFKIGLGQFKFE